MKTFNARDELHCLLNERRWYVPASVSDKFRQDCYAFLFKHDFALAQGSIATWLGVCQGTPSLVSLMPRESGYGFPRCTPQPRPDRGVQIPIRRMGTIVHNCPPRREIRQR